VNVPTCNTPPQHNHTGRKLCQMQEANSTRSPVSHWMLHTTSPVWRANKRLIASVNHTNQGNTHTTGAWINIANQQQQFLLITCR
jgi:hypothetical protein